ncbi:CRISPR-associated endonuclease Cas3'' [Streptomyces sp. QH1-20]|uniref:CRISPR-associated endonuclease Cas3'' n=1 Tax=Streptomyces sp. QH1-20 TaxID=3240934 RepID=UPI003512E8A6
MSDEAVDFRFWGKARGLTRPYPLICHLLDTASIAGELWDRILSEQARERVAIAVGLPSDGCRRLLCLWAGLHDLGKITPPFQAQLPGVYRGIVGSAGFGHEPGAERERLRHDRAGHWALTALFGEWGYASSRGVVRSAHHQVAQMLGGHHGCFHRVLPVNQLRNPEAWVPGLGGPGWAAQRTAHAGVVRRLTGGVEVPGAPLPAHVAVQLLGLIVVADWLASQEQVIEGRLPGVEWRADDATLRSHWDTAVSEASQIVADAGLGAARFPVLSFAEQFPFPPNDLQASLGGELPALLDGPGLLLVTAPTGDGKTEAGLHAAGLLARASGSSGLYFALPTMATADAMHLRVRDFAERNVEGERSLTLLHSMAWLSESYGAVPGVGSASPGPTVTDHVSGTAAGRWLRGSKRGLLAPLSTGTIDQALAGVLPVRYNVLRLLGLSNKVLVVDEAHAYGPWMHSLLVRLLEWLGAMGAPVVLLSATLTGGAAGSLVEAYRRGCGFRVPSPVEPVYPGWLFVSAGTGEVSQPRAVVSNRRRTLGVQPVQVAWDLPAGEGDAAVRPVEGSRSAALTDHLAPYVRDGGCVLVCCTTVAEAQRTYRFIQQAFPELAKVSGGVRLLHSRYPADWRGSITDECERDFGKPGPPGARRPRPPVSVLVATQVVEQSLDLDFDLVISDLAPLAQLLQRAGRCIRHDREGLSTEEGGRPTWVEAEPKLVVLEPVGPGGTVLPPRTWGTVYDESLLRRTSRLLHESAPGGIAVPGDVQRLVDAVYAEDFGERLATAAEREKQQRLDAEREGAVMAEEQLARMVAVKSPVGVVDLAGLSNDGQLVDEALVTTRLGADSVRAVCVYVQPRDASAADEVGGSGGEVVTLDPEGAVVVPGAARGRLSGAEVRAVMRKSVPLPGSWFRQRDEEQELWPAWAEHPVLAELAVLRMRRSVSADSDTKWSSRVGDQTISISEVGLSRP